MKFESADLTPDAFRDRAVRILEELSASSPHAAELLEPLLDEVRVASEEKLARMARPPEAEIGRIAQSNINVNQDNAQQMGL